MDLRPQYDACRFEIQRGIDEVIASQRFILGPQVEELEERLGGWIGAEAVACASGTDALLLGLRALQLEPGSEVIVPAFTFFATAGAVWNAGLRPVFADVDPHTYNLTAETVEAALTPRTRAVVVVHLFGLMAEMVPLRALAERHELALVEDVAQALGARQRLGDQWQRAGAVGDLGCFSFFPTKNLGAFGDAGMVTAREAAVAERVRKLRVHGGRQMYHHEMVGTNSRLDALQAAILLAKLPRLEEWNAERRELARLYDAELAGVADLQLPIERPDNEHVYNLYTVRTPRRDELRAQLESRGIGSGVYYPVPLHLQECFAELGYRSGDLPVSEQAAREVLSLPIYPGLGRERAARVAEAVGEAMSCAA